MINIRFFQVQKDSMQHYEIFKDLMLPYYKELDVDDPVGEPTSEELILKFSKGCIDMQGPHDRHLELAYVSDEPIGFLYGKVDHESHNGHKKPGFGYVMEFYVKPEYRRNGFGRLMFWRLEQLFWGHGAKRMYLNTRASGEAFWKAMGFTPTDEIQPHNNMVIWEKEVAEFNVLKMQPEHIEFVVSILTSAKNKDALHLENKNLSEWRDIFTNNLVDSDEANLIIYEGAVPVAWLKINGLQSTESLAWLSMLIVDEECQQKGIGSFAVRFVEDFVRLRGFKMLGIHTKADNIAAQNCYKKLGYHIHEEGVYTNGDGVKRHRLSLHRDNLDAVRMNIDKVHFYVGEQHDFSFISKIGKVFCVFDAMDSGNICFGVEQDGKRFFVKYAGARTQNYDGKIADAVTRLQNAVKQYEDLQHPSLICLIEHYPVGNGYAAVFDWVNGEGLRSYWEFVGQPMWSYPASPNYRFRHLSIEKRIAVVDKIMEFHKHVIERGYVPVDFYDGSMIYDFDTDAFHICDIDFYRKSPAKNDVGKMWGSTRFMSPEEYELGADLDEKTAVYLMGAVAFELLRNNTKEAYQEWNSGKLSHSFNTWSATKALFDVALKAASAERDERYQTLVELIEAWNTAKSVNSIRYRQLSLDDLTSNMLYHFNRYQEILKCWRNRAGEWVLVDNPHTMNWDGAKKHRLATDDFSQIIQSGGSLFCAFDSNKLIGFCGYDGNFMGSNGQYLWLVLLHTSYEYRSRGIGRRLFEMVVDSAKKIGAKKLYISANSSQESQAFYRAIGCVGAEEVIPQLFEAEPYDIHMEYVLN